MEWHQEQSLEIYQNKYEVIELLPEDAWIALKWDNEKFWLDFAVLRFEHSDNDGSNIAVKTMLHGSGPSGNLRECRHTYWGENGYIFYPNKKVIKAALNELGKYFDLD